MLSGGATVCITRTGEDCKLNIYFNLSFKLNRAGDNLEPHDTKYLTIRYIDDRCHQASIWKLKAIIVVEFSYKQDNLFESVYLFVQDVH